MNLRKIALELGVEIPILIGMAFFFSDATSVELWKVGITAEGIRTSAPNVPDMVFIGLLTFFIVCFSIVIAASVIEYVYSTYQSY